MAGVKLAAGSSRRPLAAAALLLLTSACAKPYNPFRIPRDELRGRIHTIALAPLRVDPEIADAVPTRAQIEPMVAARLTAGGFAVIEAKEMDDLWRAAVANVGNVFDPVTGKIDEAHFHLVQDAVYRELASRYRVNAVLYLWVRPVELYLTGASARFCGVEDQTYWPGGSLGVFEQATLVRAACLVASLYDMEERLLYSIQSGLETYETYARQTRAVRPRPLRLADDVRLRRAVDLAVGPLAGNPSK